MTDGSDVDAHRVKVERSSSSEGGSCNAMRLESGVGHRLVNQALIVAKAAAKTIGCPPPPLNGPYISGRDGIDNLTSPLPANPSSPGRV